MSKHPRSPSLNTTSFKRSRTTHSTFSPNKVASPSAAASVDTNPPLHTLLQVVYKGAKVPAKGDCVVYWMRMADLRISDNRALFMASQQAKKDAIPLIVLFVISPQDYIAHDRSARRIDFTLRSLAIIKTSLCNLHIPLHTIAHTPRRTLPSHVLSFVCNLRSTSLYANIEYEVDELRRDIQFCELAHGKDISTTFVHNKCIIEPGVIVGKANKTYAVYSPYLRNWLTALNKNIPYYLENCPKPHANSVSIHETGQFASLFDTRVPASIPGFELDDEDRKKMQEVWPAGEKVAEKILQQFLHTKARHSQLGAVNPLAPGAEESAEDNRISNYDKFRDRADQDTTSRLSVYLSAGVISARHCIRATMINKSNKVDGSGTSGIGRWVQEIAWRDFYTCILAGYPRVSMGRPFQEKFASVVWEDHQAPNDTLHDVENGCKDGEILRKWKEGMTGVPIVDAAMRCIKEMGWVHNRMRMITAMYLTKDLMIDWKVGERYFMEQLIDGDLASNNGGWQWSASTGVDPCPYFRIFNPYTQSKKTDPKGDFIKHWVPELRKLSGTDLHNPPASVAEELGYPRPVIKHEDARQRALRRYKNPGSL
ncbi:hypothetical protein L208DRAFT_1240741 [Tricholoma matsutake]|nr:hypothetical protein L208DRAFT_1240741 [Tricholoma matsutake 945]